jgi:hypothetical protein
MAGSRLAIALAASVVHRYAARVRDEEVADEDVALPVAVSHQVEARRKATALLPLMARPKLPGVTLMPALSRLTLVVVPSWRSRTKTSE